MSLDDALAAWAATVRLPDATAAGIYQRIVAAPVVAVPVVAAPAPAGETFGGLGRTWWRDFSADFTTRMISSTRAVPWAA